MEFRNYKNLGKEHKLIDYMAENLSEKNREEAALLFPTWEIKDLLGAFAGASPSGFALFDKNGDPYGMGGISDDGNIFFVVREHLDRPDNCAALKRAWNWLGERLRFYPVIWGHCWEKSTESMRWIRWLGFDFAPPDSPANKNIDGENFIYFEIKQRKSKCAGERSK